MDILFFAAIAIFIFFKLRDQLGKISDEEKNRISDKIKANQEKAAAIQKQIETATIQAANQTIEQENQANEKVIGKLNDDLKQTLLKIFARCNISAEFFIDGVKSCFEMVIKAFADKDLDQLKFLLEEKIYNNFTNAINQRNAAQKNLHSNIIAISNAEIISATINENIAFVTIKITSKQINYFTDSSEKIIEGRKDEIVELNDVWTFKKDLTSQNPNWIVSATG